MQDTLDRYMKEKMDRLALPMTAGEKDQFLQMQEKNKNDEQYRKMRALFDKPLANDKNVYRRGPVTDEDQDR